MSPNKGNATDAVADCLQTQHFLGAFFSIHLTRLIQQAADYQCEHVNILQPNDETQREAKQKMMITKHVIILYHRLYGR